MHFLETFKPLHHIFTFFSFQNTYSDDLPINIMHLYLPCPSWYLYDHTLYRWSIAFYCEVCPDVILNRVVAGGEHHHRVDMVRWLFFYGMVRWLCLHWSWSCQWSQTGKRGAVLTFCLDRVCVFCVVECRSRPPFCCLCA